MSVTANTVKAQTATGFAYQIKVNADNTVTIMNDPTATETIIPQVGVASSYDPTLKIFDLHYQYTSSSGTIRKFDTQLKLK